MNDTIDMGSDRCPRTLHAGRGDRLDDGRAAQGALWSGHRGGVGWLAELAAPVRAGL